MILRLGFGKIEERTKKQEYRNKNIGFSESKSEL